MSLKELKIKYPYIDLFKIGILVNALFTAWIGYYSACVTSGIDFNYSAFIYLICGLIPLFAGSAALNHYFEIEIDSKMERTKHRPLPMKKIESKHALAVSSGLILFGLGFIFFTLPILCFSSALSLVVLYNFIYTPLKQITWLNTYIGAIPGALPPLCGWLAISSFSHVAFLVFLVFYFWQLPHFFSIAWLYKEAYQDGGLKMLSCIDDDGRKTKYHVFLNTILLYISTVLLWIVSSFGLLYIGGVFVINVYFFILVLSFLKDTSKIKAKKVMLGSIIYQPILILLMGLDMAF